MGTPRGIKWNSVNAAQWDQRYGTTEFVWKTEPSVPIDPMKANDHMNAIETTVGLPMPEAESAVRDALGAQGFGILGACNPEFAHQALEADPSASLLLPCNVVLEPASEGGTHIAIVDPRQLMPGSDFAELAAAAAAKLIAALDSLG